MSNLKALFQPIQLRNRQVKNRFAKTATFETRGSADGFVTDDYINWYGRLAEGGVGLIHTGIVYPSPDAKASPYEVGLDNDEKIPGFEKLARTVHQHGGLILAQLHHPGRQAIPFPGVNDRYDVVGPSPVRNLVTMIKPRALSVEEIEALVVRWGEAARRAEEAGLDGVQVHVAHGYLLHAFVSPRTNKRQDAYGGSLDARLRIVRDVVREIRRKTGPEFLVTVKTSVDDGLPPGGITPSTAAEVAEKICRMDIDAIETSRGTYEYPSFAAGEQPFPLFLTEGLGRHMPSILRPLAKLASPLLEIVFRYREGFNMEGARAIRPRIAKPLICLGGFKTPDVMAGIVERGEGDMIAMGRQLIADPDFPRKLLKGEPIKECTYCNKCAVMLGVRPAHCYKDEDYSNYHPPVDGGIRKAVSSAAAQGCLG